MKANSRYAPRWVRADYPKLTGVGLFDWQSFDPLTWKGNYPNPAFRMTDREDASAREEHPAGDLVDEPVALGASHVAERDRPRLVVDGSRSRCVDVDQHRVDGAQGREAGDVGDVVRGSTL